MEPKYFFPVTEPIPLPHSRAFGLSLKEGGRKKREKPRFLRMGGEERKERKKD